jgi:cytochrome c biogenesis protein
MGQTRQVADASAAAPLVPDVPTIARARAGSNDPIDKVWRLLTSVRFAILLIFLVSLGVLAGTLIMQAPAEIAANPDSFAGWLARPRGKYGEPWATILETLDLYRVFGSFWFRGLLAVLTLSVVICTVNRMPGIIASVRRPVVRVPERLFEKAPLRAEFSYASVPGIEIEDVRRAASSVLQKRRFRVIPWEDVRASVPGLGDGEPGDAKQDPAEAGPANGVASARLHANGTFTSRADSGGARSLFADRNRYGKYGTFLNHIGIVSILGAAVLGSAFGWRDEGFMVPEGSVRQVGHDTGLSVRSDAFIDEYYPSGTAKDYRSDIVILRDGKEVASKTIRVNDPLEYANVRFHQAFFGPAAVMRVKDASGQVVFDDGVPLGYEFTGGGLSRNGGFFTLGNRNGRPTLAVYVLVPANVREPDPDIPAGAVRLEFFEPRQARPSVIETLPQGDSKDVLGYTFEFVREKQFSGLQLSYNPAVNVIWLACTLMVLGIVTVFYFPLRRLWLRVDPRAEGIQVRIAAVTNRDVLFAREFESVALEIDAAVSRLLPVKAAVASSTPRAAAGTTADAEVPEEALMDTLQVEPLAAGTLDELDGPASDTMHGEANGQTEGQAATRVVAAVGD